MAKQNERRSLLRVHDFEFHSLYELLGADSKRGLRRPGLGPARYGMLRTALQLASRRELLDNGPTIDASRRLCDALTR